MKSRYQDADSHTSGGLSFIHEPVEPALIFLEELELPYYAADYSLERFKGMRDLFMHFMTEVSTTRE